MNIILILQVVEPIVECKECDQGVNQEKLVYQNTHEIQESITSGIRSGEDIEPLIQDELKRNLNRMIYELNEDIKNDPNRLTPIYGSTKDE